MKKQHLVYCVALALAACVALPEHADQSRVEPVFSPQTFFAGRTRGEGRLDIVLSGETRVHVTGEGRIGPDGTLVLEQRIEREGDEPVETRTWRIRNAGHGRYEGTLTSARGPVEIDVDGNRLHLRFETDGGLDTEQWLYLQPGGRVALNHMIVRKFGLTVAALEETIRKVD